MGLATRLPVGMTAVLVITPRGLDAARSLATVPGVASPLPGGL